MDLRHRRLHIGFDGKGANLAVHLPCHENGGKGARFCDARLQNAEISVVVWESRIFVRIDRHRLSVTLRVGNDDVPCLHDVGGKARHIKCATTRNVSQVANDDKVVLAVGDGVSLFIEASFWYCHK